MMVNTYNPPEKRFYFVEGKDKFDQTYLRRRKLILQSDYLYKITFHISLLRLLLLFRRFSLRKLFYQIEVGLLSLGYFLKSCSSMYQYKYEIIHEIEVTRPCYVYRTAIE